MKAGLLPAVGQNWLTLAARWRLKMLQERFSPRSGRPWPQEEGMDVDFDTNKEEDVNIDT